MHLFWSKLTKTGNKYKSKRQLLQEIAELHDHVEELETECEERDKLLAEMRNELRRIFNVQRNEVSEPDPPDIEGRPPRHDPADIIPTPIEEIYEPVILSPRASARKKRNRLIVAACAAACLCVVVILVLFTGSPTPELEKAGESAAPTEMQASLSTPAKDAVKDSVPEGVSETEAQAATASERISPKTPPAVASSPPIQSSTALPATEFAVFVNNAVKRIEDLPCTYSPLFDIETERESGWACFKYKVEDFTYTVSMKDSVSGPSACTFTGKLLEGSCTGDSKNKIRNCEYNKENHKDEYVIHIKYQYLDKKWQTKESHAKMKDLDIEYDIQEISEGVANIWEELGKDKT